MFYLNLGYFWQVQELGDYGVCVGAHGVSSQSALTTDRRNRLPTAERRLFDPQLYLRDLDLQDCEPVVTRLATYAWLNPAVPEYEEGQTITDWTKQVAEELRGHWPCELPEARSEAMQQVIKACLDFQVQFGVGGLIIPAPVTRDPESDFSYESKWIDAGLELAEEYGLPIYATLALRDTCLMHRQPTENELLKIIVDQIAARTDLNGVYMVLEQAIPSDSVYLANSIVAWSLLSLCYDLGTKASLTVIVNFADVFGLACLAAGAKAFCAGPYTKGRRLSPSDFETREGGGAYPRFYAHSLILNLLPRDIGGKIAKKRLLRLLNPDDTEHSKSLFAALRSNQQYDQVVDWQERAGNTGTSHDHYVRSVVRETDRLLASGDRISHVLAWLQDAERNADYLAERFDTDPLSADHRHVSAWRAAFESFLSQYGL